MGQTIEQASYQSNAFKELWRGRAPEYTPIVPTIGPEMNGGEGSKMTPAFPRTVSEMIEHVDGFRLCIVDSVRDLKLQTAIVGGIKKIAARANKPVFIFGDFPGGKARLSNFPVQRLQVDSGETVTFVPNNVPFNEMYKTVPLSSESSFFLDRAKEGHDIVVADGSHFRVIGAHPNGVICEAVSNTFIEPGRGVTNLNDKNPPVPLTAADSKTLEAVVSSPELNYDGFMISFVQNAKTIKDVKNLLSRSGKEIPVVAKIETQEGVDNVYKIVDEADGLLVACSDLGLLTRKQIFGRNVDRTIAAAKTCGKPWMITADVIEGLGEERELTRLELMTIAYWKSTGYCGALLSDLSSFHPEPVKSVLKTRKAFRD